MRIRINGTDVRGPHIRGRPGQRFIYLSWGSVDDEGRFNMSRRAKLMLAHVPAEVRAAAAASGMLEGTLGLTDAKGASVVRARKATGNPVALSSVAGRSSRR